MLGLVGGPRNFLLLTCVPVVNLSTESCERIIQRVKPEDLSLPGTLYSAIEGGELEVQRASQLLTAQDLSPKSSLSTSVDTPLPCFGKISLIHSYEAGDKRASQEDPPGLPKVQERHSLHSSGTNAEATFRSPYEGETSPMRQAGRCAGSLEAFPLFCLGPNLRGRDGSVTVTG